MGWGLWQGRHPLTATHSPLRQVDRAPARAKPSAGAGATGVRGGGRPTKPQCAQAAGAQAFASRTAGLGPRIVVVRRPPGQVAMGLRRAPAVDRIDSSRQTAPPPPLAPCAHHGLGKANDPMNPLAVAIRVAQVTMVYPGAPNDKALDNVGLDIFENEFFTLLGPSGCGKTTLLRLIAGFEQPTRGEIRLDGASLVGKLPFERPVNTVFQSYALFPHMTVAQNIAFGPQMQRKPAAQIKATVEKMLALVRLTELGARKPAQLSGGQQQRVALARALATHPRVLLLDESLSALDLQLRKEMQVELKRLQRETGITFVFVTHDQEEALTMSDRIAVMCAGRVQQVGSPAQIYERPTNRFVASFIGETNLLRAIPPQRVLDFGHAGRMALPDSSWTGPLTLAVRPERLQLVSAEMAAALQSQGASVLQGTVRNLVYMGHDTTYSVQLQGQSLCSVRTQNAQGAAQVFAVGDAVGLRLDAAALRRLND